MLSTEIQPQQEQLCLQPCCFDSSSIPYEYQGSYEDYQLQYQYQYQYPLHPEDPSSPSPDQLVSPASSYPFGIMSVDHNIPNMSGASPSPSDTTSTTQPPDQYDQYHHQAYTYPQQQQQLQQEPYYQHPNPPLEKGVMEALEIARETEDGLKNETIRGLLERAITHIWDKVLEQPDSYILGKDEFAVFNFFQNRFRGNEIAIAARRRFWATYRG